MPPPPASTGGAVDDEPLLPEYSAGGHGGGGASVSGAVFNVSTSIVGAGIMSIPAAMRVLGVVPALFLIAAVAALADVSVEFMLRYTGWAAGGSGNKAKQATYAGIMGDAFGRAGAAVLNVFIAFTTTGTLVVYLIIIGDVMSGSVGGGDEHAGVLQELFGPQWWTGRQFVLLITAVFVLLPLVLRRRVGWQTINPSTVGGLENAPEWKWGGLSLLVGGMGIGNCGKSETRDVSATPPPYPKCSPSSSTSPISGRDRGLQPRLSNMRVVGFEYLARKAKPNL